DPVFSGAVPTAFDGAVLGEEAFVLRWCSPDGRPALERLMLVNLGRDLRLVHAPEPLLAPPPGGRWRLAWSSEAPQYGGNGTPPVETESWNLPSASAVVLLPTEPMPAGPSGVLEGRVGLPGARAGAGGTPSSVARRPGPPGAPP